MPIFGEDHEGNADALFDEQIERYETVIAEKEDALAALDGQEGPEVEEARQQLQDQITNLKVFIEQTKDRREHFADPDLER